MIGSIIQPLFFPWAGYFHLISRSDIFIFLDDAQFKKTWCSRNKIILNGNEYLINMPLMKQPQKTNINQRKFYNFSENFQILKNRIYNTYKKNKFFSNIDEIFFNVDDNLISNNLSEFNIYFIKKISQLMNITTKFDKSSNLKLNKKRSEKLIEICKLFQIDVYLSPQGSKEYMKEDSFEEIFSGKVRYNNFVHRNYSQNLKNEFISHLSILDLISNMSWKESFDYIYSDEINYL